MRGTMKRRPSLRQIVQHARDQHARMAEDRERAEGTLGDRELHALLVAAYPTLAGQRN
jgi:hypothetical protein